MSDQNINQDTSEPSLNGWVWGPVSGFVLLISLIGLIIDQGTKLWLVYSVDLAQNGPYSPLPFLDIVLVWNRGISYGLFQQYSDLGRWLLAGLTVVATIALWVWSVRTKDKFVALSLALIIGGALGNGIDRVYHGAVVDFLHFYLDNFSWYVFNLADVWIVAGVIGLMIDSFFRSPNSAAK